MRPTEKSVDDALREPHLGIDLLYSSRERAVKVCLDQSCLYLTYIGRGENKCRFIPICLHWTGQSSFRHRDDELRLVKAMSLPFIMPPSPFWVDIFRH